MAFPPERITVKRRRDEDPVEALFIQQKKQRPSGFWKLVDDDNDTPQYAVLLSSSNAVKETRTTTTAFQSPRVPTVRTTLPSEDFDESNNAIPRFSKTKKPRAEASAIIDKRQLQSEITQHKQSRQKPQDILASALRARKFHLVINPSPISSPLLVPKTTAQKHRKNRRKDLAIFVERTEVIREAKKSGSVSRPSSGEPRHLDYIEKKDISQLEKPRKRPNATAAERKWRTETWANPPKPNEVTENLTRTAENINEPSSQWNYESTGLAEQLQEVALEEIRASEERAKGLSGGGKLKVKPKPPKPRQPRTETSADERGGDDIMLDTIKLDDDGDYVLDTYVRSSAQPFRVMEPTELHHDSLNSIDPGNIGILVIEDEEEEALWEAFAEDQESDPEWNSEEEDENAEDYYGNDYPEDEVNSDDEFGRGAYNYRHAASDDEEFGWSDDE
ncbi:hypothetical protein HO173_007155 [Letharia columbiana]|uniref:Transcription factor Iwr1 domain-containing protein n=1 Tax=Letharia columbiana TaxID=112416 RepID=A0A8H6FTK5_9LECA|nr:uncharacterized protein HO173_007155 [Letharia columbiana]KAF6234530.1 hypothetical protein HO173_007155 [Letharia columbiana]